jgi:hypothetical protein
VNIPHLHAIRTCLATGLLLTAAAPVPAQDLSGASQPGRQGEKVMLAYCIVGQGCQGYLSDVTHSQMQVLMPGTDALKGAKDPILVFPRNKAGEWTYYVDTRRSLIELHQVFGGVGEPETRLFPPELPGEFLPRSGQWQIASLSAPVAKDCLPGMAPALARQQPTFKSGPVTFKSPFHGRQLLDNPAIQWIKTAPNRYAATFQSAGNQMMFFRYEVQVVSPERIDGTSRVVINIPSQKTCTVTTPFRYTRTGN